MRKIPTDFVSKFPNGIDISGEGDILVGDSHGNQVTSANVNGHLKHHNVEAANA